MCTWDMYEWRDVVECGWTALNRGKTFYWLVTHTSCTRGAKTSSIINLHRDILPSQLKRVWDCAPIHDCLQRSAIRRAPSIAVASATTQYAIVATPNHCWDEAACFGEEGCWLCECKRWAPCFACHQEHRMALARFIKEEICKTVTLIIISMIYACVH